MTPEAALCIGRDRLLNVEIKVGDHTYLAIVDTGATCSYLPQLGRVVNKVKPRMFEVNVKSRMAVSSQCEVNNLETILPIHLAVEPDLKPVEGKF